MNTTTSFRATIALALIFVFRMLGLFMILPVFSVYATQLHGSTPVLVGIALGSYGLTQAIFQIPFGTLSDRFGRKSVIAVGLVIFALGSVVAALSHSIIGVMIGRALQGAGAIGSTIMAMVADLTRAEHRTRAMAILGIAIGLSFTIAMVLGPILNDWIGVPGIFWLTAALASCGVIILFTVIPEPPHITEAYVPFIPAVKTIFKHPELLRLNISIFFLHLILTAMFVALPIIFTKQLMLAGSSQWQLYLSVLLISFVFMMPLIRLGEKRKKLKPILLGAIAVLFLVQILLLIIPLNIYFIAIVLILFFTAFNLLEASLPSLISRTVPPNMRGTAMGIYSSNQFLGIFIGGSLGGWIMGLGQLNRIFLFCALVALVWFFMTSIAYLDHKQYNGGGYQS